MDRKNRESSFGIFALSLGCIIGWGSFVMPGTTFLPKAGPEGTVISLSIACVLMLMIGSNYSFLHEMFPSESGTYGYTRMLLGEDHGFLASWAMLMAYMSLLWANVSAFVLIFRYFVGNVLQWGFHYVVTGYDVYLGEILFSILLQTALGFVAILFPDYTRRLLIGLVTIMLIAASVLFIGVWVGSDKSMYFTPPFAGEFHEVSQVISVITLAPWMFVGFEVVTQRSGTEDNNAAHFQRAIRAAIICGTALYVAYTLIASSGVPEGYSSWSDYVSDLSDISGSRGLPVLYNVERTMGRGGTALLVAAIVATLLTSVLGFYQGAAKTIQAMSERDLMPRRLSAQTSSGTPVGAMLFIMLISLPIPFIGRTAVGWNADVSTLAATICYAYISIGAWKEARRNSKGAGYKISGMTGFVSSVIFFLLLIVPNIFSDNALSTESYLMLAVWSLGGILYYLVIFLRDRTHRFGRSPVMWIMMLFLLFFVVTVWLRLSDHNQFHAALEENVDWIDAILLKDCLVQMVLAVFVLIIIFFLFMTMAKRERDLDMAIIRAEEKTRAKTSFLSNMSHDIRTPMNAIIGFTDLALLNTGDQEKMDEYLGKIKSSSMHLLSLINDVLEMSRIESGKIDLTEETVNLPELLHDLNSIIIGQVRAKQQELFMDALDVMDEDVISDKLRLNQVLLNLVSNAVKYTPNGGKIWIRLIQKGRDETGLGLYEIRVKDNGIGMTKEFAERVFEEFEREKSSTVSDIQGTGLGMAITKRIIDLMGGDITVDTVPGEGSEFIVRLKLKVSGTKSNLTIPDVSSTRVLVVDDDYDSCNSMTRILLDMGLSVDWTISGREALLRAKQAKELGKAYGIYIIDWSMPDMNGIEVARQLKQINDKEEKILLMTAYDWAGIKDEAYAAGVKGFCRKPVFATTLQEALVRMLKGEAEENRNKAKAEEINKPFTGKKVLLVEDMLINREIAKAVLSMCGFEVDEAEDGEAAVKIIEKSEPGTYDAVLMDIQMPNMNGYDAARAIRALSDSRKASVPIVAMTANAFDEDRKNALEAGMNAHIAKPIDREKLVLTLSEILGITQGFDYII